MADNEEQQDPIEEIKTDVKKILKIMNGNGQVGLCAKVSILWKASLFIIAGVVVSLIRDFF